MTPAQKRWIQLIHVAKSKTGIDDDAYRAILQGSAGVDSAKEIASWAQYKNVMSAFRNLGFKAQNKYSNKTEKGDRNSDWITYKQEYYIRGLWGLASAKKNEQSLRAMCKRITGVDDLRFCPKDKATNLILALRDITEKAGFNPDNDSPLGD